MARARDGRDLLDTYQPGNRASQQRIIRAYQEELIRSSFLLTGDATHSHRFARLAYLDLFRTLSSRATVEECRERLLTALARQYLEESHHSSQHAPGVGLPGAVSDVSNPRRSRVLELLGVLNPTIRAALVLREFNLMDEEAVCQILDMNPFELRRELQPVRQRLEDLSGGPPSLSARELLIDAAMAASRPHLENELDADLDALHRDERQRRRYSYIVVGIVGLALLIAGLWLFNLYPTGDDDSAAVVAPTVTPTPIPTTAPEPTATPTSTPDITDLDLPQANIPARILIGASNSDESEFGLFDVTVDQYSRILDYGRLPYISADGAKIIAFQNDPNGSAPRIIALDSTSGEPLWDTPLPANPSSVAITTEKVYVLLRDEGGSRFHVLELETGRETAQSTAFTGDLPASYSSMMWASLDGQRLYLAIAPGGARLADGWKLAAFQLPDLTLESLNDQTNPANSNNLGVSRLFGARLTPDGAYLYSIAGDAIHFRNADRNDSIDIQFPYSAPPVGTEDDLRWITSNDGRYLYVVALMRAEVAVVDLLSRRLVRSFPIDFGAFAEHGLPSLVPVRGSPGSLTGVNQSTISLSDDGAKLYLASGSPGTGGSSSEDSSLIWSIDLATWRIEDRWEIPGLAIDLATIGHALYVSTFFTYLNQDSQTTVSPFGELILNEQTGEILPDDENAMRPEWAERIWMTGLPDLYRATYGRVPAVNGVALGDAELASTLPRAEIATSSDVVPAGKTFGIEVRIIDVWAGEDPAPLQPEIRFDPTASVVMRLRHEDSEIADILLVPTPREPGVYQASAMIEQMGYWSVELTLTSPDGLAWSVWRHRVIEIVPSFEASDGARYVLDVETESAEPIVGDEIAVRAQFIDISTGKPLPSTEHLVRGMPDEMRLSFVLPDVGFTSANVIRMEDGAYEGTVVFQQPGIWPMEISFELDNELVRVGAGQIKVTWN